MNQLVLSVCELWCLIFIAIACVCWMTAGTTCGSQRTWSNRIKLFHLFGPAVPAQWNITVLGISCWPFSLYFSTCILRFFYFGSCYSEDIVFICFCGAFPRWLICALVLLKCFWTNFWRADNRTIRMRELWGFLHSIVLWKGVGYHYY